MCAGKKILHRKSVAFRDREFWSSLGVGKRVWFSFTKSDCACSRYSSKCLKYRFVWRCLKMHKFVARHLWYCIQFHSHLIRLDQFSNIRRQGLPRLQVDKIVSMSGPSQPISVNIAGLVEEAISFPTGTLEQINDVPTISRRTLPYSSLLISASCRKDRMLSRDVLSLWTPYTNALYLSLVYVWPPWAPVKFLYSRARIFAIYPLVHNRYSEDAMHAHSRTYVAWSF